MMAVVGNELGTRLAAPFWLGGKAAEAADGSQSGLPRCLLVSPRMASAETMGTTPVGRREAGNEALATAWGCQGEAGGGDEPQKKHRAG